MGNSGQTKKKHLPSAYILMRSADTASLIKNELKKTLNENKIEILSDADDLPSDFNRDTYLIVENNKSFILKASKTMPKRNLKLILYAENLNSLNENDIIFLIRQNFDHIFSSMNLKNLKYEKFTSSKIFRKRRPGALINKDSTLLNDLCVKLDENVNIFGISGKIKNILDKSIKVAGSDSNILITGESGTGKELIARVVHLNSKRKDRPMVSINCGAFPEGLLESELFGHKKGAFTGAFNDKPGRFELADKSTLFMDEIGDMGLPLQVKLLRVLQEREIELLGDTRAKKIDVRIISATNKNLEDLVSKNIFREDFYYRINVVPIYIPPLRERKTDIIVLIYYFLKKFSSFQNEDVYGMSETAFNILLNYPWNGNTREIENLMEMLVVVSENGLITEKDLPEKYLAASPVEEMKKVFGPAPESASGLYSNFNLKREIEGIELGFIREAMEKSEGRKEKAAKMLGINRTTLIEKLKKYRKAGKGNIS